MSVIPNTRMAITMIEDIDSQDDKAGDKMVAHTFKIRRDLLRECQNAVAFCAGHPHYLKMSELLEDALTRHLQYLKELVKKELKQCGGEFPEPKRGRRVR